MDISLSNTKKTNENFLAITLVMVNNTLPLKYKSLKVIEAKLVVLVVLALFSTPVFNSVI